MDSQQKPILLEIEEEVQVTEKLLKDYAEKIKKVENTLDTKSKKYIDLLYAMARLVRNVEGKSPSSTGPEIGQLLCKLRCLDGERYDKEVLLCTGIEVDTTVEGAVAAAKSILVGAKEND